jgi:hypothetical protein
MRRSGVRFPSAPPSRPVSCYCEGRFPEGCARLRSRSRYTVRQGTQLNRREFADTGPLECHAATPHRPLRIIGPLIVALLFAALQTAFVPRRAVRRGGGLGEGRYQCGYACLPQDYPQKSQTRTGTFGSLPIELSAGWNKVGYRSIRPRDVRWHIALDLTSSEDAPPSASALPNSAPAEQTGKRCSMSHRAGGPSPTRTSGSGSLANRKGN